jgi:hypothetical protein
VEPGGPRDNATEEPGVKIVGLTGAAGSGKDTAALALISRRQFMRVAFADPIRCILLALNPIIAPGPFFLARAVRELGWDKAKRQYSEIRRYMQALGEAGRETLGEDVWIRRAAQTVAVARQHGTARIVITDVRYENEAEWIESIGGYVLRIEWPDSPHKLKGRAKRHKSESRLKTQYKVKNATGDISGFRLRLLKAVDDLEDNPTPAEIYGELAPEIRSTWTPEREREACQYKPTPYEVPVISDSFLFASDDSEVE